MSKLIKKQVRINGVKVDVEYNPENLDLPKRSYSSIRVNDKDVKKIANKTIFF